MSWRDNLTTEQRARVAQMEAAAAARRVATWGTPDCVNCEDAERAGGAWWLDEALYCGCANGARVKVLDAERREHLKRENAADAARAARACSRCGGSGRFAHLGECFRCHGNGIDPKFRKVAK